MYEPQHVGEALAVAWETMRRVRHNLVVILQRLDEVGYRRAEQGGLASPVSEQDLIDMERHLEGPFPLSLRAFWEVVGGIDLQQSERQIAHDWLQTPPSEVACLGDDDPLVVPPPWPLAFALFDPGEIGDDGQHCVTFSQDRFHKGHVSGGQGYGV